MQFQLRGADTEADTRSHDYVTQKTNYPHAALKSSKSNGYVIQLLHIRD